LIENGAEKLDFVAKYKETDASKTIADDITKTLSLELDDRNELTKDQFLRHLTQQTEEKGILVLRNGKVGLNTKRILDVEEFRGFALIDPIAPLIFINTADFIAAQIFTFAHELAHIWIGRGGVSNASLINDIDYSLVENVCNTVAAEVLVPQEKFKELWDYNNTDFHEQAENLSRTFKVSSVVIARRALDMELISKEIFFEYYKTLQNIWRKVKKRKESGANFHSTFPLLNSRKFTDAVCNEIYSDRLLMREGMALLGTSKYQTIDNYAKEKGLI
jgi:Zn-dependent peptidase ImmA (M78 family)